MSLLNMYDFTNVESDEEGMRIASRFDKDVSEVQQALTAWMHKIAVRYNNPKKKATAAKDFRIRMEELEAYILSDEAGENQWTKANGRSADFKLTGSKSFTLNVSASS